MRHRWRSDGVGNRRLEGSFDQSAPRTLNKNHFWRRREGVEPSGDLTAPRLVLKTSGTTGHLPSPRDKNQLANTSANSGKDTAEHAMVNSLHRIAMIRGNEKDPRPDGGGLFWQRRMDRSLCEWPQPWALPLDRAHSKPC